MDAGIPAHLVETKPGQQHTTLAARHLGVSPQIWQCYSNCVRALARVLQKQSFKQRFIQGLLIYCLKQDPSPFSIHVHFYISKWEEMILFFKKDGCL